MPDVSCQTCGKTFTTPQAKRKYCSRLCYDKAQGVNGKTVPCVVCGTPTRLSLTRMRHTKTDEVCCSQVCKKSRAAQPIEMSCFRCGKTVERTIHQIKRRKRIFCSEECYRPTLTITCMHCGKPVRKSPANIKNSKQVYCSQGCHYAHRTVPLIERFWKNVDQQGPEECWPWLGHLTSEGYGEIADESRNNILAHRLSYELHHGSIPEGLFVRHVVCGNPQCVNPTHLAPGTPKDNSEDMVRHGRSLKGEKNPNAIMTADMVRQIRQMASTMSPIEIARAFGLKKNNVSAILRYETWKHIS